MGSERNGNKDEDCLFLEHVLDKLYDFGPKKKSQKKKKQKRCKDWEEEEELPAVKDICSDTEDYRAEQHDAEQQQQQQRKAEQTGRQHTFEQVNQVEVVTFQDPTKKRKKSTPDPNKTPALHIAEKEQSDQLGELNLEKARLEVHRFGITGYKKEEQRVFEQDRAVMLGARPPKKEYANYKMLQQQIKEKKEKEKEEAQLVRPALSGQKTTVPSGPGAAPSGQVGRFKNGMLLLSSKEIQKIKGNK
uniref:Zgc:194224 n=1 Tax=Neolamprologus brichardi TaxID=32507 RepID=A0A3Q4GVE2_NEOBR